MVQCCESIVIMLSTSLMSVYLCWICLWTPRAARQHVHSYRERTENGADVEGSRRGSRTTCRGDMPQHRSIQTPFREQAFWKLSACRLADRPDESRAQALFTASVTHGDGWTGVGRPQVALEAAARSQLQKVLGSIKYVTAVWDITTCCLVSVWRVTNSTRGDTLGLIAQKWAGTHQKLH